MIAAAVIVAVVFAGCPRKTEPEKSTAVGVVDDSRRGILPEVTPCGACIVTVTSTAYTITSTGWNGCPSSSADPAKFEAVSFRFVQMKSDGTEAAAYLRNIPDVYCSTEFPITGTTTTTFVPTGVQIRFKLKGSSSVGSKLIKECTGCASIP
jgi:hypothetical protein